MKFNIRNKTIEELEGERWSDSEFNSHLVKAIHLLRKKPLKNFTIEDLRICISQQFFLEYLVEIAIEKLQKNPFAEGDLYTGDLLENVLRIKDEYWFNHTGQRNKVLSIINNAIDKIDTIEENNKISILKNLEEKKAKFFK